MGLKDLVGSHKLTGVDRGIKPIERWPKKYEDCEILRFTLGSITYMAIENPDDGYRSAMKEIIIDNSPTKNIFPGVQVSAMMRRDDSTNYKNDILELFDTENNKLILAVGTQAYDDYYPMFVSRFHPENMHINESK